MYLYNSLTGKKELFVPLNKSSTFSSRSIDLYNKPRGFEKVLDKNTVTLYVCGITPYDTTHLGHAFTYISFDILVRYLKYLGYRVIYTQNVTDINDRDKDILQRAKQQNIPWKKLAEVSTKKFLKDMKRLNWIMPANYLKASENIKSFIVLIKKLIVNGFAYKVKGSVYFSIDKDKEYGKLSGFNKKKMFKVAKDFDEDLDNPDKKNPLDITLWRAATGNQPKHIPSFKSPFGPPIDGGRPGWHIECSAMSMTTLGEQIDIHGGGIDLLFPHHEAEIAQAEGATGKKPFVKYWMHTGNVFYQGEKMSKSKGNFVLISDMLKKYSPNAVRWLLLSHHHQENWEFEEKELSIAEQTFARIKKLISQKKSLTNEKTLRQMFTDLMNDNLNTPKVLLLIKDSAEKGNTRFAKTALQKLGFL